MKPEFVELNNKVEKLFEDFHEIKNLITRLNLNNQFYVKANAEQTIPGIQPKIAFNEDGLVIEGFPLEVEDIPNLPIDKIVDLRRLLNQRLGTEDIQRMIKEAGGVEKPKKNITPGTGTKINYDETGSVTSSTDLTIDDIPDIPIKKIIGLVDRLEVLESLEVIGEAVVNEVRRVKAGTYPKITVDEKGNFVNGEELSVEDIPGIIMEKIDSIFKDMKSFASQESVDSLNTLMRDKITYNPPIEPGTYSLVSVDKYGLVTKGDKLSIRDLPQINISNIPNLETVLKSKINNDDFLKAQSSIESELGSHRKNFEMIRIDLADRVGRLELGDVITSVRTLEGKLNTIIDAIPNENIGVEIKDLKEMISTLVGRVTVLEQKANIESDFNNDDE